MPGPEDLERRDSNEPPKEPARFFSLETLVWPAQQLREFISRMDTAFSRLQTTPEPERKEVAKETTWYAVGRLTELTESGARGPVWKAFADIEEAKAYRDKHNLALFPGTFAERPAERTTVEVSRQELDALQKKGQGKELAQQLRILDWEKEQGIFHEHGVWYDRKSEPRIDQVVHVTSGLDYRDEPEDHRIFPSQPLDPGASEKPQHVVYEKIPGKPLLARIVSLPASREEAKAEVKSLDEKRLSMEPEALERQWREFDAGSDRLRSQAYQERRAPLLAEPEKPTERPRAEPLRVTTHEKGRHRAEVLERMGEDGKPQRMVILSKDMTEADGRTRIDAQVLSMDDVREMREAMERKQEQMLLRDMERERQQLKITTHETGRHRAEVVERLGEDGKPQGIILLSRETTEPDGRIRTQGTVLDFDDVREIGRAMKQHQQQKIEQAQQEEQRRRAPRQEPERDQGLSMEP